MAAEVRAEMARQRVTQQALAGLTGISQARLSRRLAGQYSFTIDELTAIAVALEVPFEQLLKGSAA